MSRGQEVHNRVEDSMDGGREREEMMNTYDRPKPLTNMWYFLALNALTDVREIPVVF